MKKRAIGSLLSAALALGPLPVIAEPGQIYLTPFVGVESFDTDAGISQSTMWGAGVEYQFTEHLGAEVSYALSSGAETRHFNTDVDVEHLHLNGLYYFGRMGYQKMYEPYLKLGASHFRHDYDGLGEDEGTQVDAGLGVRFHLAERWSARAEALALHDTGESNTHGLYTIGVSYAIGGAAKPAPAPAPAPAVAPPPAPPADSDGDGVIDERDRCPNTPRGREVDENGCEYVLRKREEIRLDIKFDTDKAEVKEDYMVEVERVAKFLRRYGNVKAVIEGHTDSTGSNKHNEKLSQARADAVRSLLVQRYAIDPTRLSATGYGETRPIASNDTLDGRAQNRRVVAVMEAEVEVPVYKK